MRKKRLYKLFTLLLTTLLCLSFYTQSPQAQSRPKIKVAFPLQDGLTMKSEDGSYFGYDYDYLMSIAQYTGWELEFVEVEGTLNERLIKLLDMLMKSEIDIMGGFKYNESLNKVLDFSSEPYGNAYHVIAVNEHSEMYDFSSLINKEDLRIAVLKNAVGATQKLVEFATVNGFSYEEVLVDSEKELALAVENGKADAILTVDLSKPSTFHSIARFSPEPFYFATSKGNSTIIAELNQALNTIKQLNPTLPSNLYNRYFVGENKTFKLSKEEKSFVRKSPSMKVLVSDNFAPIQYQHEGEYKGVGIEILRHIEENTDLKFEYILADNYDHFQKLINEKKIDIVLSAPHDYQQAGNSQLLLSDPYLNTSLLLVTNDRADPNDLQGKRQGLTIFRSNEKHEDEDIIYYDSSKDVLDGLDKGEIDYSYINSYILTYYTSKYNYKNISSFPTPDYLQSQYSFGLVNDKNNTLMNILNKGIRSSSSQINTFIYKNSYSSDSFHLSTFIQENILSVLLTALVIVIIIFFGLRHHYREKLRMKNEVELEYQRYLKLSEISGEATFSYDYRLDELKISSNGVSLLAESNSIKNFSKSTHLSPSLQYVLNAVLTKADSNKEVQLHLLNQKKKWYRLTVKVIYDITQSEYAVYAVGRIKDIQVEVIERQRLQRKSQTDVLTSLYNREGMQEKIDEFLKHYPGQGALLIMDLDNFKSINDTYGHLEGDRVLSETARLLSENFPDSIVGRFGGDEFIVFDPAKNHNETLNRCRNLLNNIHKLAFAQEHQIFLTISIGIVYTETSSDIQVLMKLADDCLYDVKRHGRNNYRVYK